MKRLHLATAVLLLAACGGGGGGDAGGPGFGEPPAPSGRLISGPSPVAAACIPGGGGTVYANAEVEPFATVDPTNPQRLLAAWQQDRISNGGARAMVSAFSSDGGTTWQRTLHPFSRCGGASPGSAGDYERATDPWVEFGPDGTAHAMALAFSGGVLAAGSTSAMLASRSSDGGRTWSAPATLVRDGDAVFNDKNALTPDPTDARFVYAVWARFESDSRAPAYLARSTDGGASWEPARPLLAPPGDVVLQGNRIVVLPSGPERGVLVNVFNQIDRSGSRLGVVRSNDKGLSWSAPVFVAAMQGVGTFDAPSSTRIRDGSILPTMAAGPDGTLWVAWQDARLSGGARDAIALSRSTDGGRSWSAPVAVNRATNAAAFTPTLHVRADGLVGLLHYDLRSNTDDPATLVAEAWLISSRDGVNWSETRAAGPFDLRLAPLASSGALFLGDYLGLTSSGTDFVPVLVAATGDVNNRTEVHAAALVANAAVSYRAQPLGTAAVPAGARRAAIDFALEQRLPGRAKRQAERAGTGL